MLNTQKNNQPKKLCSNEGDVVSNNTTMKEKVCNQHSSKCSHNLANDVLAILALKPELFF